MMATIRPKRGFTLAEVLVATTIGMFITLVAAGALKAVSDSAQLVDRASETSAELRFATRTLAHDLENLYRDADRRSMRLVGASQTAESAEGMAFLRFYMVGRTKARPAEPESDVYEVEYILRTDEEMGTETTAWDQELAASTLYRRLWPNPDRNRAPGGILTPVARGIDALLLRFYDGQEWTDDWPEQRQSIPELVEVTLAVQPQGKGSPLVENFIVNFARLAPNSGNNAEMPGAGEGMPPGNQGPPPGPGQS